MTRLSLVLLICCQLYPQGVATRGVKPQSRARASGRPFPARFVDIARQAGLTAPLVYGSPESRSYIVETNGSGAAFLDFDNDGLLDVLLLQGGRLGAETEQSATLLYRNRGSRFEDVTARAGLIKPGWASSVCAGDFDNDGHEDFFVTYWGPNSLYRNQGDGTFRDVTGLAGLTAEHRRWGAGCTFVDYDRDGDLDLFVSNYLRFDMSKVPMPGKSPHCYWKGVPVFCGPMGLPPEEHLLYRNEGAGKFADVTASSGIGAAKGSYGMTAVAADFDEDGWQDIYVACDSTPSLYFRNRRNGTFAEEGVERGVAVNEDGREQAGMGIAVADFDLDGKLDLFKTHFLDDTHVLYRNEGDGHFEDVTLRAGIGVETRWVGWGAGMADFDHDGWPDILLVTGNVYPGIESKLPTMPYRSPRVLFRNLGDGRFEQLEDLAGPAIGERHTSRGAAFGDFDNDGDVDVLVMNMHEPPSLLRNDRSGDGGWLAVKLVGTKSNRSAVGATVIARYGGRSQAQAVTSQASYYSANDRRLHFGLGAAREASLEIRWPSGLRETVAPVAANQMVVIREGSGIVERWPHYQKN
jgi:hypothetical protein